VSRRTLGPQPSRLTVTYGTLTRFGRPFQQRSASQSVSYSVIALPDDPCGRQPRPSIGGSLCHSDGLGSSRFAHRYYGNPLFSSGY
jgi:hypothetical protein